jgi:krueppel-like factor 15
LLALSSQHGVSVGSYVVVVGGAHVSVVVHVGGAYVVVGGAYVVVGGAYVVVGGAHVSVVVHVGASVQCGVVVVQSGEQEQHAVHVCGC